VVVSLKRNLVANYFGQGWSALLGLAFLPIYIGYLGMEAFGLIGLFAAIQSWLSLLDIGMTPTLNREMARFTAGAHSFQSIRNLLRSIEVICYGLAILIALGVWGASGYLATDWLKAEKLPVEVVAQTLSLMSIVIAMRFCEGIYRGCLFGMQRQVFYNGVNALLATIRYGGAWVVLAWISPTIEAFFIWQAIMSLFSLSTLAISVHRLLPRAPSPAHFSQDALKGIWKFASGMMGITFLALLLTQVDKVLLSKLLRLEDFGYYTLAATISGTIYMITSPITLAIYPRMVELATGEHKDKLVAIYHQGAQLVTVLIAPAMLLLSIYSEGVLFVWSGDVSLAQKTAPLLAALVLGTFLNGLMWMPYQCQLAYGWTSFAVKVNAIAVMVLIPAILWVVPIYGAIGAAWIWVVLNAGYALIGIQLMHRRLLPEEKWNWYWSDVFLPVSGALVVVLLARLFMPAAYNNRLDWLIFLLITGLLAMAGAAFMAAGIRSRIFAMAVHYLSPKQAS
jgi:O-antigen/teichoic acid export membrane protein